MITLLSSASIEIATKGTPDAQTLHLLRRRLDNALEEALEGVLAEFDIENHFQRAVRVDEIEVSDSNE